MISVLCVKCGNPFETYACYSKRGGNKYCSPACYHEGKKIPIETCFWEKVIKTGGCWGWHGARHVFGYGQLSRNELKRTIRYTILAHRMSWEIHFGPIPDGLQVLHKCDNPPCTRPDHLFLGTYADNMEDMTQKGRRRNGVTTKLTEKVVKEIRSLYGTASCVKLASRFGVHSSTIWAIGTRKYWKHLV
jgi:HNH endonuclease